MLMKKALGHSTSFPRISVFIKIRKGNPDIHNIACQAKIFWFFNHDRLVSPFANFTI